MAPQRGGQPGELGRRVMSHGHDREHLAPGIRCTPAEPRGQRHGVGRARRGGVEARAGPRPPGATERGRPPGIGQHVDQRRRGPVSAPRRIQASAGPVDDLSGPGGSRDDCWTRGRERLEHGDTERLGLGAMKQAARALQVAAGVVGRPHELDRAGEVGFRGTRPQPPHQRPSGVVQGRAHEPQSHLRQRPPGDRDRLEREVRTLPGGQRAQHQHLRWRRRPRDGVKPRDVDPRVRPPSVGRRAARPDRGPLPPSARAP